MSCRPWCPNGRFGGFFQEGRVLRFSACGALRFLRATSLLPMTWDRRVSRSDTLRKLRKARPVFIFSEISRWSCRCRRKRFQNLKSNRRWSRSAQLLRSCPIRNANANAPDISGAFCFRATRGLTSPVPFSSGRSATSPAWGRACRCARGRSWRSRGRRPSPSRLCRRARSFASR